MVFLFQQIFTHSLARAYINKQIPLL